MKGLVMTHMGRREEGLELVKKGVRLDLTSHIVWHVFGLIQKGEKNYEEALKSYTQALRFDRVCHSFLRCLTATHCCIIARSLRSVFGGPECNLCSWAQQFGQVCNDLFNTIRLMVVNDGMISRRIFRKI